MRRAFVMGSNGPENLSPLRFAGKDADHFKEALSAPSCDFTVETPPLGASSGQVRDQIYLLAESCTSDDTFVCYFSGHGLLDRGALFLLWDKTERERLLSTAISVSDIMQALKHCKAHSKLLILDCCHAGAVVNMTGLRDAAGTSVKDIEINPENHLVLMASDRLEKAREVDELQGGFLTTNICAALTEKFSEADKDRDNRISIPDLKQWLEERAKAHNRQFPDRAVPYPYLFGQQRGDFYLTVGASDWVPYELPWHDGSTMVVLPRRPDDGFAWLIGKHPITNAQYRRFVEESSIPEPQGQHYINGQWVGPFYPWREESFSDPDKPVVCVSLHDAQQYCHWAGKATLPNPQQWDFAAFGTIYPNRNPDIWLTNSPRIHHKASSPATIDRTEVRMNSRGLSDMIGNVWEWCGEGLFRPPVLSDEEPVAELRGGSFLDDLSKVQPFLDVSRLTQGPHTCHTDLGFRIWSQAPLEALPEDVQRGLSLRGPQRPIPNWSNATVTNQRNAILGAQFFGDLPPPETKPDED